MSPPQTRPTRIHEGISFTANAQWRRVVLEENVPGGQGSALLRRAVVGGCQVDDDHAHDENAEPGEG